MGLQLMHFDYLIENNHPIIHALTQNPSSFVGEDVEISLMLLANSTDRTSTPYLTESLNTAYVDIGILNKTSHFTKEDSKSTSNAQTELPWRLGYNADSKEVLATVELLGGIITKCSEGKASFYATGKKKTSYKWEEFKLNLFEGDFVLTKSKWEDYARARFKTISAKMSNSNFGGDFSDDTLRKIRSSFMFNDDWLTSIRPFQPLSEDERETEEETTTDSEFYFSENEPLSTVYKKFTKRNSERGRRKKEINLSLQIKQREKKRDKQQDATYLLGSSSSSYKKPHLSKRKIPIPSKLNLSDTPIKSKKFKRLRPLRDRFE